VRFSTNPSPAAAAPGPSSPMHPRHPPRASMLGVYGSRMSFLGWRRRPSSSSSRAWHCALNLFVIKVKGENVEKADQRRLWSCKNVANESTLFH
jgi:hypothetical protein